MDENEMDNEAEPGTCAECGEETCPPHRPFKCAECAGVYVDRGPMGVVEGLRLIAALDGNIEISAGHDIIYAGRVSIDDLPVETCDALERLGWHYDREYDSWAVFT